MLTQAKTVEHMYTIFHAAQVLGLPEHTIRRMIHSGRLQGKKLANRWLIPASELKRVTTTQAN